VQFDLITSNYSLNIIIIIFDLKKETLNYKFLDKIGNFDHSVCIICNAWNQNTKETSRQDLAQIYRGF
jgi:hypothetical protein